MDKTRLAGQEQVNPGEMFVLVQIWFPEHLVTPESEQCSKKLQNLNSKMKIFLTKILPTLPI